MAISTTKRSATPRKSTTTKTAATKAAASKVVSSTPTSGIGAAEKTAVPSTATGTTPEPKVVSVTDATLSEPDMKKPELIDLVVERSGIKKKDAKPVVEALLAVLGETIADGRELNLQPLGKLRINRTVEKGNGRVIVCKLRQSLSASAGGAADSGIVTAAASGKESLAEPSE